MKKLLFICFLFYYVITNGQDSKVVIKIDSIAKDSIEIIVSKTEFSKKISLYDKTSRESFKERLKTFYSELNDSVSVVIDTPFTLIKIIDLKNDLDKKYNLTDADLKKEFKDKLTTFYNPKKVVTISELNKRLKIIENDEKHVEAIGFLELRINNEKKIKTSLHNEVKVDSISFQIKSGSIYEVFVRMQSNATYRNRKFPLSLNNFSTIKSKHQVYNDDNSEDYIYFSDILKYVPKINNHFIPRDTTISIKLSSKKHSPIPVEKDVYLKTYIAVNVYTDIFSLINDVPNGQLQTEFSSKFNLNIINIPSYYGFFFAYVQPKVKYSTFNDDVKRLDLDLPNINNSDILQRSYLDLGLKLNLFKGELGNRMGMDISSGVNYSYTRAMKDSIPDDLNLFETFGEIRFHLKEYHNFGITSGIKASYTNGVKSSFNLTNINYKNNWFIEPEVEIYYYPVKDKKNKIFLRFQYLANTRDHSNDFSKFQFGYKIPIKFKQE